MAQSLTGLMFLMLCIRKSLSLLGLTPMEDENRLETVTDIGF